jgi:hypothetical protein
MVEIRVAVPADIPTIVELHHELALLRRLRLAPYARETAVVETQRWLDDPEVAVLVATLDNQPIGYIVGRIQVTSTGLLPERNGVVSELVLDLHQYQGGAARLLFDALRKWFSICNVEQILVSVPQRSPIEQAFWRGLGAVKWMDGLWIK